jgi:hypothetical protein
MSEYDFLITDGVVVRGPRADVMGTYFVVNRQEGVKAVNIVGKVASYKGKQWKVLRVEDEPTSPKLRARIIVEEVK